MKCIILQLLTRHLHVSLKYANKHSAKWNSVGFKIGKSVPTKDLHEITYDVSQPLENLENENESTSLGSNVVEIYQLFFSNM